MSMKQNKFCIVIPSYKNEKWCEKNIASALSQNYSNFRIVFTDDFSPDKTAQKVEKFVQNQAKKSLVEIHKNSERLGALHNLYTMIHNCADDEIVVTLDGDDWFPHPNVLSMLNNIYQGNVWLTYGQYKSHPDGRIGCSRQIPQNIIQTAGYRQFRWCSSHLRTFYSWLFKRIKKEDLTGQDGKFYIMTWDLFFMFPMLEMSAERHRFVKDVLYIYNYENPINDAKVNLKLQQGLERFARAMPKYSRIEKAPIE